MGRKKSTPAVSRCKGTVYKISSAGKNYIGKTTQPLSHRMSQHRHAIKAGHGDGEKFIKHFKKKKNDIKKARVTVVDHATTERSLHKKERKMIAHYKSDKKGLNSTK